MNLESCDLAPARARINLASLEHNVKALRQHAPGIELIGVVKANAYGHGSVQVSRALSRFGVSVLAVATVPEAIELRDCGVTDRILVFGAPRAISMPACVEYDLEPVVTGPADLWM